MLGPESPGGQPISSGSSAASPGAGPTSLCAWDWSPWKGPSAESWGRGWGPGGPASLPGAEVSARGTGGAGAGGFISPGGGPPIDGAGAVHCTPAVRQCGTGAGGAGGGDARDAGMQGQRARGRTRARQGRERGMWRGRELQRRRRDAPGGSAGGESQTGGGGESRMRRGSRKEGGAEMERGPERNS